MFLSWFEMIENKEEMDTCMSSGWVKIPFIYGFIYLRKGVNYEDSISNFKSNHRGYNWKRRRY